MPTSDSYIYIVLGTQLEEDPQVHVAYRDVDSATAEVVRLNTILEDRPKFGTPERREWDKVNPNLSSVYIYYAEQARIN